MLCLFSVTCGRCIRKKWKHMTTMHMTIIFWMLHLKLEAVVRIRGCLYRAFVNYSGGNCACRIQFPFCCLQAGLSDDQTLSVWARKSDTPSARVPTWCIFTMLLNTLLRWILFCCWPQPHCCVINNTNGSLAAATERQISHETEIHVWI